MIYGYVYAETNEEAREGRTAMQSIGIAKECIVVDKAKTRKKLLALIAKLQKGDMVYVKSLSSLGAGYLEMRDMWNAVTNEKGASVEVLSMPELSAKPVDVNGIISGMLLFSADYEKAKNRKRQRAGYLAALDRGVKYGRPAGDLPENFEETAQKWKNREIKGVDAARELNMPLSSFRYRASQLGYHPEKKEKH